MEPGNSCIVRVWACEEMACEEISVAPASDYLPKRKPRVASGNSVLCTAFIAQANNSVTDGTQMEPMSGSRDRAKRYCDRANECLQILATSQTPGTGEIYLQIAEHYLLLATSQKKASSRTCNRPAAVPFDNATPSARANLPAPREPVA